MLGLEGTLTLFMPVMSASERLGRALPVSFWAANSQSITSIDRLPHFGAPQITQAM